MTTAYVASERAPRPRRVQSPRGLRTPLGLFQYLTMLTIDAHGAERASVTDVENFLHDEMNITVDTAQVYVTVQRLEVDLRYLSYVIAKNPEGSGRLVKRYEVTTLGRAAMVSTAKLLAAVELLQKGSAIHERSTTKKVAKAAKTKARVRLDTRV